MSDLPRYVHLREEGPREGFQVEPGPISTQQKIELIDALSTTGVRHIQVASFVSPKAVPGWADAEAVVAQMHAMPQVEYTALWLGDSGLKRALAFRDKLHIEGALITSASDTFCRKNLGRSLVENSASMRKQAASLKSAKVRLSRVGVMAAFGCNFSGDVDAESVVAAASEAMEIAAEAQEQVSEITLADSMGWCTPGRTQALVGAVRDRWPDIRVILHLHDTRGMGVASAYAALSMGVDTFDSTVAGLGGCPFAGQPGASGNIATEELALLCAEMGIETGIDLDAMIDTARFAEQIVGHPLPSTLLRSSSFAACRRAAAL